MELNITVGEKLTTTQYTLGERTLQAETVTPSLQALHQLLNENPIHTKVIKKINIKLNPDLAFSKSRHLIAFSNALAYTLGVPINDSSFLFPQYNRNPNITPPRND